MPTCVPLADWSTVARDFMNAMFLPSVSGGRGMLLFLRLIIHVSICVLPNDKLFDTI